MKKGRFLKYSVLGFVATVLLSACTHNNGDIGIWFGTWHVSKIARVVDGEPVQGYEGHHFMQFQSGVVRVVATDSLHNFEQSFGMWDDKTEGLLHVYFPDDDQFVCTMPGIERDNVFTIEESGADRVILSHTGRPDETALRYWLVKQY